MQWIKKDDKLSKKEIADFEGILKELENASSNAKSFFGLEVM